MTVLPSLSRIDAAEEEWRGIAVQVEINETAVLRNVLLAHVAQEVALAASRLAEHHQVPHTLPTRERHATARWTPVHDSIAEIQAPSKGPCSAWPRGKAIPDRCNELFKKANHGFNCLRGPLMDATRPRIHVTCHSAREECHFESSNCTKSVITNGHAIGVGATERDQPAMDGYHRR
jgi:hypothetical protein